MLTTMKGRLDDDIDSLFQLPLTEFIGARNALATRLKKDGRAQDAEQVKSIAKPSLSVWAVNQLFWRHRSQFDELISAGQRFRRAHTSRSGKPEELNQALEARREAVNQLSDIAAGLLRDAGHSPTLDTLRRVATTLESMSAYAALPADQAAGRLTKDLDPPGFESLAPFIRAVPTTRRTQETLRETRSKNSAAAAAARSESTKTKIERPVENTRLARLAAAKASLQVANKSLAEAKAKTRALQTAQKKADGEVKNAEKQKRDAEQRFKEASAACAAATVRAHNVMLELKRATKALADAEDAAAMASQQLQSPR